MLSLVFATNRSLPRLELRRGAQVLVLVVGPSGAGKDTLLEGVRTALKSDPTYVFVRREITRPAEAEDSIAIDLETFLQRRDAGAYALSWQAHGHGYGISRAIDTYLQAGRVVVANVSRGVIEEAARRNRIRVVEISAPAAILVDRLAARGRETAAEVTARLLREAAVPGGVELMRIVNDKTVAEGVRRLLDAITAPAEFAPRS